MHPTPIPSESTRQLLALAHSLQSRRRSRDRTRSFWIEGTRQFVQACDAGFQIKSIVRSPILLKSGLCDKLQRRLCANGARRVDVTPEQFREISLAPRASGIGAIAVQSWQSLNSLSASAGLGWLVVESLRSPGNLGTMIRTAEAAGMAGIIFLSTGCDPFEPAVVRASMGGVFHLRLSRTDPTNFRRWATANGVNTVGLSPGAAATWIDVPLTKPTALLLGDERHGLSPAAQALCSTHARLPMTGKADSLNVAIAAGVMMCELTRRSLPIPANVPAGIH
jgi:TrmH family RNA methyltransferase